MEDLGSSYIEIGCFMYIASGSESLVYSESLSGRIIYRLCPYNANAGNIPYFYYKHI